MDADEQRRRAAFDRVKAALAADGIDLTVDDVAALESYFRGEATLDELIANVFPTTNNDCGSMAAAGDATLADEVQPTGSGRLH
jgi:hypothetical protein